MILAQPVLNGDGIVLLGEGTELTDAMIERLNHMHHVHVCVKGTSRPEKPLEEMLLELDRRFAQVEGEPYMAVFKKVLREHIEGLYQET